ADSQDGIAALLVQHVGFQLDANAAELFERMAQHQEFGFGVGDGPLPGAGEPGRADFDLLIWFVNVHVPRAADYAARALFFRHEWECRAIGLPLQSSADVVAHVLARMNLRRNPAP